MLAVLIGCGLRRGELLAVRRESLQQRDEHWVVANLVGRGGHVRTLPVPTWVKAAMDTYSQLRLYRDFAGWLPQSRSN
jgi:integrase